METKKKTPIEIYKILVEIALPLLNNSYKNIQLSPEGEIEAMTYFSVIVCDNCKEPKIREGERNTVMNELAQIILSCKQKITKQEELTDEGLVFVFKKIEVYADYYRKLIQGPSNQLMWPIGQIYNSFYVKPFNDPDKFEPVNFFEVVQFADPILFVTSKILSCAEKYSKGLFDDYFNEIPHGTQNR